ncbi:hypothetical protein Tco_0823618 [Tanacetum coccineum]|uniref:Uncharacterized protein n=1 Tax=Tanacetum coccineum TaxID=301880 RepID=A0ABQ5AK73_9ASTR
MSDMTACLNDLSYIPLNNEQNEPTQGDIGETSNDPTQAKRNEFEELYASANEELYPGCMCRYICVTIASVSGHANKDVQFCPVCNTSRWKDSNTPGKKVPKKVLRYFPIIPRLQRLYKSSHTTKEMTWHATGKCTEPEPRNVRLGLAADGFNPFATLTLIIHGPKSLGKDIDVYLRPLIDDLKDLWAKPGVETIDVATEVQYESDVNFLTKHERRIPAGFREAIRQRHVDNDPGVSESSELFALACGPSQTPISVNSCVVNGVEICPSPAACQLMSHGVTAVTVGVDDRPPPYQTQFDLRPHMESDRWPQIYAGIQQHLQKIYNGKKAALKERYWMETSATREYPSLIHTFFLTHTVGGVFLNPEDKALYDEMLSYQGLGSNTPTGVPYTEDEIMTIVRGGKQRGTFPC